MKTTLNTAELKKLGACEDGFNTFFAAHGDRDVKLSDAFGSNGWNDAWWYLTEAWESLSKRQQDEINLLGCDWAESCLHRFEGEYPNDERPRLAIEAKRKFIAGEIDEEQLGEARSAVWSAARSAASAAESAASAAESAAASAARSAAWSAASAAASAARSAAWSAARSAASAAESAALEEMKADLLALFEKWESEQ